MLLVRVQLVEMLGRPVTQVRPDQPELLVLLELVQRQVDRV